MKKEYKPEWAKRLEDWGKRMDDKYGDSTKCDSCGVNDKGEKQGWEKRYNPVGDIFGQFISYLLITYIPVYFPGFFSSAYSALYIVLIYSIVIHVAVDIVLIFLRSKPFYYLGQVITNITSIAAMIVMVTIFPFNFPGTVGDIVQFALWIAIGIVSLVTVFDFLKIFSPSGE